jgi:putative heme-binding domain-containing protein
MPVVLWCLLLTGVAAPAGDAPVVHMLVPGFTVQELPLKLSNQNNLRFAPDGTLYSLGYDGKIWRLRDTDGDGLEDTAEPFWNKPTLSVPLGMDWSTHGLFVSSKGKVSLLKDTDGDSVADAEEIIASGWPSTDVGSGGVDATAVTLDEHGNVYFGLLVADYSNAYRLRKRKELKPEEITWLKQNGRWHDSVPSAGSDPGEDQFSLYSTNSPRGTIQEWDPRTKTLQTVATGIRVPVALAFNRAGDLFNTDQEGETWMPNGNPLDELNQIIAGKNYGFPPRQDQWLPGLASEAPVVAFAPQHQSACGLIFNEPHTASARANSETGAVALPVFAAQGLFGPKTWEGDAFVAGESRGKIWRVHLVKTPEGYVGRAQTIARLSMLTLDLAISPRGDLYVTCHSGNPDWGTGPQGAGKIFKISYTRPDQPVPLSAWPSGPSEVRVRFDKALDSSVPQSILNTNTTIEFGEYVGAGDRFEVLKPPYAVVQQQDAAPRGRLAVHSARLDETGRILILQTDPHPLAVHYAVTLAGIKSPGENGAGSTVDLDYDLTRASQPLPENPEAISRATWHQPLSWAPKARSSGGTDSRAAPKPDGDWQHGREMFFGELQCFKCHRIRGEGGIAGPDLSNLIHRDAVSVLRDIREPSATIHPDYVTYQVATKDGEVTQGFIRSQGEDAVQLFDVNGKETRIPRADIESLHPTELSLMPAGLLEGRKTNDVRDILTFLLWEPPRRSKAWTESFTKAISKSSGNAEAQVDLPFRIVLVASKQDHGPDQHDYPRWQTNWARLLNNSSAAISTQTAWEWPSEAQFDSASVLVFYCWNHNWSAERLSQLDHFLERGGGVVLMHAAVIADEKPELLAQRIGLSAQPVRTGYRHMPFDLHIEDRQHPITKGFPEFVDLIDEPYWPLIGNPHDVHVLASANIDGQSRPLIWVRESSKGRIFASVPGHYTFTWNDPFFRTFLLRGIAWAGHQPVDRLTKITSN